MTEQTARTPLGRVLFFNGFKIRKPPKDKPDLVKYDVTFLWPPDTDFKEMNLVIQSAITEKWAGKRPPGLKMPLKMCREASSKDGIDIEAFFPEYAGSIMGTLSSYDYPFGICDKNRKTILDPKEVYPGCWGLASYHAYGYENEGKGVSLTAHNFIKLKDDEKLGRRVNTPEDEFESLDLSRYGIDNAEMFEDDAPKQKATATQATKTNKGANSFLD